MLNRREALQAGIGLLSATGIDGEIATVSPRNPQMFVITIPGRMSHECASRLRDDWKKATRLTPMAGVPLFIMQGGMQLSVVDQAETESPQ